MFALVLAGATGLTLGAGQAHAEDWSGDGGLPAFYTWGEALPDRPGTMLRTEAAPDATSLPGAARAERILYTSSDWRDPGKIVTVSGVVFLPAGKPPKGGWPLIGWAHGTTGIADVCAPSALPRSERDKAYLGAWLARGYAIVASDYQGLGTRGPHPYLQFRAEGRSVLDAMRAVLSHYPELSRRKLVTMGQSQGAEGAIAAAYLAPTYAPELHLLGTVATGVVAHTTNVGSARQAKVEAVYADADSPTNSAYETLWFLGAARTIDPERVRPEDYLTADGLKLVSHAQHACMRDLVAYARLQAIPYSHIYRDGFDRLDAVVSKWTDFPDVHLHTPVFVGTGLKDKDALPVKQFNFASAMCAAGTVVEMHTYPGEDHSSAVTRSLADSPRFVEGLLRGRRVKGNCATLQPPG